MYGVSAKFQMFDYNINNTFGRHESFAPRFHWFKKGYDAVSVNPVIFYTTNAHIDIGVGKNMANAIRYWGQAYKIIESNKKYRFHYTTEIGDNIFSENGFDPYLENEATLWLLHYFLIKNPNIAPVWYFAFCEYPYLSFSIEDLFNNFLQYHQSQVTLSSIQKDILCLIKMYVSDFEKTTSLEEALYSPFHRLGLIQKTTGEKKYLFNTGSKPNLPPEIIVALCLDYVASLNLSAKTISLSNLAYEKRSPGMVCKINEREIEEAIEQVSMVHKNIALSNQAGVAHLAFTHEPKEIYLNILNQYYKTEEVMV